MSQSEIDETSDLMDELGAKVRKEPSDTGEVTEDRLGGLSRGKDLGRGEAEAERAIVEEVMGAGRMEEDRVPVDDDGFDEWLSDAYPSEESLEGDNGFELGEEVVVDALESSDTGAFLSRFRRKFTDPSHHRVDHSGRVVEGDRKASGSVRGGRTDGHSQGSWRLADRLRHFATTEGADESELMDEAAELAASGKIQMDEAILVVAGLAVRKLVRLSVASVPRQLHRRLVRTIATAARDLVQQYGPQAIRAILPIVRSARRVAVSQRTSIRELPRLVQRTAARVARSPQTMDQLSRSTRVPMSSRMPAGRGVVPQSMLIRGPVYITIRKSCPIYGTTRSTDDFLTEPSMRGHEPSFVQRKRSWR